MLPLLLAAAASPGPSPIAGSTPTAGSQNFYIHRSTDRGGAVIQSAWTRHTMARHAVDMVELSGKVYMLTSRNDGGQTLIEQWPTREEADVYPAVAIPSEGVPNEAVTGAVTFTPGAILGVRSAPTQFTVGDYGFTDESSVKVKVTVNSTYDGSLDSPDDYSTEEPFQGPYQFNLEYLDYSSGGGTESISWGTRAAFAYDSDGDGTADVSPSTGSLYEKSTFQATDRTGTTYYFFIKVTLRFDTSGETYDMSVETSFDHFNLADVTLPTFPGNTTGMKKWLGHDGSVGSATDYNNVTVTPTGEPHVGGLYFSASRDHPSDVTSYSVNTSLWANTTIEVEASS